MKKFWLILFLGYTLCGFSQSITKPVYSYLLDEYLEICSDVPALRRIGGGTKFIVTYEGDWTNEMKGAFEYACKIWEEQIPTALPIRITAKVDYIFSSTNPVSEVIVKGEDISYQSEFVLNTRIKGVYFSEQQGNRQFLECANVDWLEGEDGIVTYNLNRINDFSFSLEPEPTDKYDFVTIALRDIAKLLGFYWGKQGEPITQTLNIQGEILTPYEKKIAESIGTLDVYEAYRRTTKGTFDVQISQYGTLQLYAPDPWIKGMSLNYSIPNPDKKLTEILSYKIGRGSVVRNITDNYSTLFKYVLGWIPERAVGGGGGSGELPSSTEGLIPYKGKLDLNQLGNNREINFLNDSEVSSLCSSRLSDEDRDKAIAFLAQYTIPYHPNLSVNGDIDKAGWNVSFLKKDGTWDVLYEFRYPSPIPLHVDMASLDFKNVDDYARTYDGYLRCRISQYGYEQYFDYVIFTGLSKYYVLDFLPQKPKMQFVKIMPTTYSSADEYARTIKIAINDLEGTNKIIVEQLDEGETYPQKYEIKDFKKGYFTATVDKEFSSQFTIIAYNDNGSVKSEILTVSALEPPMFQIDFSLYDNYIKIHSTNMRLKEKQLIQSYSIYKVDDLSMQKDVTLDTGIENNEINVNGLNKGFYVLSVCDIYNKTHNFKFFR